MADKKEALRLMTPVGRLINNSLFEKDVYTDDRGREAEPSYKIEMVFGMDDLDEFEQQIAAAAEEFFGGDALDDYWEGRIASPISDGDEKAEAREKRGKNGDAYKGTLVLRAHTKFNRNGEDAPGGIYVCGANAKELDFAEARTIIYNGGYGMASVTVNCYHPIAKGLPGVSLYLNGYQFAEDGERLRGADPSSLFSPMMGAKSESKGRKRKK